MRQAVAAVLLVCVLSLSLAGCDRDARKVLIGTAIVGLILGTLVALHWDRLVGDRSAAVRQHGSVPMPTDGNIIDILRYELAPGSARPGALVQVRMDYLIMAMNPDQKVDLEEWRIMRRGDRDVTRPDYRRRARLEQGVYTTESQFRILSNTPSGRYTILTILATEGQFRHQRRAEATLLVE